jgi:UDP-4-amino-4-deoxy-L-arabinose formyltransferase/UDP-glucuronic acid dehydrogenase (UDP-4-keto-hexauronic acid decarboxylating)
MNFVALGRGDILYSTVELLLDQGHQLVSIITSEGAPEYRKQISDFQELAAKLSAPILVSCSNSEISAFLSRFRALEIGVSVNHKTIVSEKVLGLFERGVLNLHGGDLPRYRGNACQAWAIINGETQVGACVHYMEPGEVDSGKIINRRYFALEESTKIRDCLDWLEDVGPTMFSASLESLEKRHDFYLEDSLASDRESLRCYERRPEDGLIDWSKSPREINRLVNASGDPYFGAFTYLEGEILKIHDCRVGALEGEILAIPGQVIRVEKDYVSIACEGGILDVLKIEFKGIRSTPSSVLRSTRFRVGR